MLRSVPKWKAWVSLCKAADGVWRPKRSWKARDSTDWDEKCDGAVISVMERLLASPFSIQMAFLSPAFIILLSLCFHLLQTEALPWLKACRMMHLLKPLQKPIFISQKCPTLPEESANTHHKISQKLSIYPVREWRRWNYIAISVHFDSPQWIVLTTLDSQQKSNWCRVVDSFLLQLRN